MGFLPKIFKSYGVSGWDIMCYSCKLEINRKQVLMKRYETEDQTTAYIGGFKRCKFKTSFQNLFLNYVWINILCPSSTNHKFIRANLSELILRKSRIFPEFIKAWWVLLIISLKNWFQWKSDMLSQKCLAYLLLSQDLRKSLDDTLYRDGLPQEMKRSKPNGLKLVPVIWHLNVRSESVTAVCS